MAALPQTYIGNYTIGADYTFECDFIPDRNFNKRRLDMLFQFGGGNHQFFFEGTKQTTNYFRGTGAQQTSYQLTGVGNISYHSLSYGVNMAYRHLTIQYDSTNDEMRMYADGYLVFISIYRSDRGNYNASSDLFPTTGGSGGGGAIEKGNYYRISVGGILGGTPVTVGQYILALVNTPGQTAGNWDISDGEPTVSWNHTSHLAPINANWALYISSNTANQKFNGSVSNVTMVANATPPTVNPPEPEVYIDTDYAYGYVPGSYDWSTADDTDTQYLDLMNMRPVFTGAWQELITSRSVNMNLVAGYAGTGGISQPLIDKIIDYNVKLSTDWYHTFYILEGNLCGSYEDFGDPTSLTRQLIDYAVANPPTTCVEFATAFAQANNIAPYTWVDMSTIAFDDPLSNLDDNVAIYGIYGQALYDLIGNVYVMSWENDEVTPFYFGETNPAQTQYHVDVVNTVLQPIRDLWDNGLWHVYRVYDQRIWRLDGMIFDPYVEECITKTSGVESVSEGTIQFYPRTPSQWNSEVGNDNGVRFYLQGKRYEESYGFNLNAPFAGAGWDYRAEENICPAQWLGLLLTLAVRGVDFYRCAYFYNGHSLGDPQYQEPPSYFWQLFTPPIVKSALQPYRDFLTDGIPLQGDMYLDAGETVLSGQFWSGNALVPVFARRLGNRYMIGCNYNKLNNYDDQELTYDFQVTIMGITHYLTAPIYGRLYIYDADTGTYEANQTNSWEDTHYTRWSPIITPPTDEPPYWITAAGALDGTFLDTDTAGIAAALALQPDAADDYDTPTVTQVYDSGVGIPTYIRTRRWQAEDSVGNISTLYTQLITIIDTTDMALEISNNVLPSSNGAALQLYDTTGAYNISNLTGYGSPNPEVGDFVSYVTDVTVPNSSTYLPTGATYTIDSWNTLPTTDTELYVTIPTSSLGQSAGTLLLTGVYQIVTTAVTASNVTYTYTNQYLIVVRVQQAIWQLNAAGCTCCSEEDWCVIQGLQGTLDDVCMAWNYGLHNKALCILKELVDTLSSLGKTGL